MSTSTATTEMAQSFGAINEQIELLVAPGTTMNTAEAWPAYIYNNGSINQAFKQVTFVASLDIDHHDNHRSLRWTNVFTTGAMFSFENMFEQQPGRDAGNVVSNNLRNLQIKMRLQHSGAIQTAIEQVKRVVAMCPKVQRVEIEVVSEHRELATTVALFLREEDLGRLRGPAVRVEAMVGERHRGMPRRIRL